MVNIQHYEIGIRMKTKQLKLLSLLLCFAWLFAFTANARAEQVSDIVLSLIESQKREIDTIKDEYKALQKNLNNNLLDLTNKTNEISLNFHSLSSIFENGSLSPNARSILTKQINELHAELKAHYTPLEEAQKTIDLRIAQLNSIITNFKIIDSPNVEELNAKAQNLLADYQELNKTLSKQLPKTQELLGDINKLSNNFEEILPKLWLDYYLNATDNLFSSLVWQNEIKNFKDVFSTTARTLRNDLPNTSEAWILFTIRVLTVLIILGVPLYSSVKFTKKLPETIHNAWKRILKQGMPYILMGIAFYYGSLQNHTIYQISMGISAVLMCHGLIRLAFILHTLHDPEAPSKPSIRIFVPVLFASLALLTFTPLILTLSFIWTIILLVTVYTLIKTPKSKSKICQYIMGGFLIVNIIGILITPSGLARLSILITLLYICLGVGIYLAFGVIHLAKITQDYLQAKTTNTFAYELAYAFLFPVLLLICLLAPFTWIFAYPGGIYLIKNFSNLDFNFGTVSVNTLQIFTIFIAFYITKSIINVLNNFIDNNLDKNTNNSISSLTTPIKTAINFGCWALFLLYALNILGFSLTSITVVAGGLSVGIGLGLQSFVQNIFSGFSLIFGQNIREGDVVDVAGISGVIQKISLRATQIKTAENAVIFVPNSAFLSSTFTNWTHNGKMVRKTILINVAYNTDLDLVTDIVMQVVKNNPDVLSYPEPSFLFTNFGDSSLDFELRIWVADLNNAAGIMAKLRLAINNAFKEKGIEIPFPQTDIHIHQNQSDTKLEQLESGK